LRIMMSAAGSPVAPGIIRHLQKLGHYVIGHDCQPLGPGASMCNRFVVSQKAAMHHVTYVSMILECGPNLYLPFLDEELEDVCLLNENIVMRSPIDTVKIFTSKGIQQEKLEHAGLPIAPLDWRGDWIAKPERGRGSRGILRGSGALHSGEVLARALMNYGRIVQKFIDGDEYTVDVITGLGGDFLFGVPRRRIQANSVSTIGQIVMDQEIIGLAKAVVSKFQFYGPINIQMIREKDTGKLYIIEVNARLSGSCMFTVMAGWDILADTIRLHQGLPFEPPKHVKNGIVIRRHYVEKFA